MKPAPFDYYRPADLPDAFAALAEAPPERAKLLAGGQSLMPMLNLRLIRPERVIDIRRLPELLRVRDDGAALIYGAALTHAAFEDRRLPDATPGWLAAVAHGIAYRAVRNRGTIGGSLVHADPAADWVTALTALGGEAIVATPAGERAITLPDFFLGSFATRLAPDEILSGVRVPKRSAACRFGYWKFCRKVGEFAKAIGAVLIDPARDEVRAVVGAIERPPIILKDAASLIRDPRTAGDLIAAAVPGLDPIARRFCATALERAARRTVDERAAA
jgi:carbon-monoxide dehydrogenase medium subunit